MRYASATLASLLACSLAGADLLSVKIPNGDMSFGGDKPAGWEHEWTGRGNIVVSRDTQVYHSAPASLKVASKGGSALGNACCLLDLPGGKDIDLTGWVKTDGTVSVNVMAQAFGSDFSKGPLGFLQLAYVHGNGPHDWSSWTKRVTLPEGTVHVLIGMLIEGEGSAWLDDVRNSADPEFRDREAVNKPSRIGTCELAAAPEGDPVQTALPRSKPWVPGWCRWDWRSAWVGMHDGFVANTKQNADRITAVFYGDSITMGWGSEAKELFAERYGKRGAVNYGIGGDSTRQLLWRISHGEVDGLKPKVVVLKIGTNNLYDDANAGSDEEIAQGIAKVVELLRAKLPETKILLLGMLPRENEWFCGRVSRINAITAKLDDGKVVRYLDMGAKFASAPGNLHSELYNNDRLHLAAKGYAMWADTMQPLFDELMGK
jgi:lysophospholipase L1-like esterase